MERCFICEIDMTNGGIVQENQTILCSNCDSKYKSMHEVVKSMRKPVDPFTQIMATFMVFAEEQAFYQQNPVHAWTKRLEFDGIRLGIFQMEKGCKNLFLMHSWNKVYVIREAVASGLVNTLKDLKKIWWTIDPKSDFESLLNLKVLKALNKGKLTLVEAIPRDWRPHGFFPITLCEGTADEAIGFMHSETVLMLRANCVKLLKEAGFSVTQVAYSSEGNKQSIKIKSSPWLYIGIGFLVLTILLIMVLALLVIYYRELSHGKIH